MSSSESLGAARGEEELWPEERLKNLKKFFRLFSERGLAVTGESGAATFNDGEMPVSFSGVIGATPCILERLRTVRLGFFLVGPPESVPTVGCFSLPFQPRTVNILVFFFFSGASELPLLSESLENRVENTRVNPFSFFFFGSSVASPSQEVTASCIFFLSSFFLSRGDLEGAASSPAFFASVFKSLTSSSEVLSFTSSAKRGDLTGSSSSASLTSSANRGDFLGSGFSSSSGSTKRGDFGCSPFFSALSLLAARFSLGDFFSSAGFSVVVERGDF
mmetsp:Transcript_13282/g.16694  ORF Transcript_13282/g.16694 Transcript_13282/m.16694 type:complete len:276 (+) Transcript_13282:3336-4163(+)